MKKPYFAVIFTSTQSEVVEGYPEMSQTLEQLAEQQPGYLGIESARSEIGITVSYWESLEAIAAWKKNTDHRIAQKMGRSTWYNSYHIRICKVEREYSFTI